MVQVTLYTKTGCGLCDEVQTTLALLAPQFPHQLTLVDITTDPELHHLYRYSIPVVLIDETTLNAPIAAEQLANALQTAVAPTSSS